MIYPEDDIIFKQESSCPKEDAVAKLLGWMRGVKRKKYVQLTIDGISEDQLEHLHTLDGSVHDQLSDLHNAAYIAYCEAVRDFEPNEVVEKERQNVERLDGLIRQASSYLQAIDRELQSDSPTIKVDQQATESTGVLHLDLNSLDLWAHRKYQFSIFDPPSLPPAIETHAVAPTSVAPTSDRIEPSSTRDKHRLQEKAIVDAIRHLGFDPKALPKHSYTKPGAKANVRNHLNGPPLFRGSTVFDKAWERLRKFREIADKK